MSNGKGGFAMPPPRQSPEAQAFIAGADTASGKKPEAAPTQSGGGGQDAQGGGVSALPWEGQDEKVRVGKLVLRMTAWEKARLDYIVENKPGARSLHDFVLKAVTRATDEAIAELLK